jgi:hypothetical protein
MPKSILGNVSKWHYDNLSQKGCLEPSRGTSLWKFVNNNEHWVGFDEWYEPLEARNQSLTSGMFELLIQGKESLWQWLVQSNAITFHFCFSTRRRRRMSFWWYFQTQISDHFGSLAELQITQSIRSICSMYIMLTFHLLQRRNVRWGLNHIECCHPQWPDSSSVIINGNYQIIRGNSWVYYFSRVLPVSTIPVLSLSFHLPSSIHQEAIKCRRKILAFIILMIAILPGELVRDIAQAILVLARISHKGIFAFAVEDIITLFIVVRVSPCRNPSPGINYLDHDSANDLPTMAVDQPRKNVSRWVSLRCSNFCARVFQ